MSKNCRSCASESLSVSASRVDQLAIDTGLGIQGVPMCSGKRCRHCRHRRCRC